MPWRIGVAAPDGTGTAFVLEADDLAVATSGTVERGRHIRDGRTGAVAPAELVALTVAGPSLARADWYAAGAFAMGRAGLRWMRGLPGYGAAAITADGGLLTTEVLWRWRATTAGQGWARGAGRSARRSAVVLAHAPTGEDRSSGDSVAPDPQLDR